MYSKKRMHLFVFALQVVKAMQQIKGDDVIKTVIDEVLNPQLSQIIVEAWLYLARTEMEKFKR